ncbi:MAG: hypothetical protein E6H07_13220 [Bacteroidetes bacterium]|nr:MAG: hypothetical protein E6H07_13220 [Bacteroidota bacterium]
MQSWKYDMNGFTIPLLCEIMTLYQFNMLNKTKQAEAVWNGVHIGEREDGPYNILLYQVHSFYVEVYYHRPHNSIIKFRSFSSTTQLAPYLEKIDIMHLIK